MTGKLNKYALISDYHEYHWHYNFSSDYGFKYIIMLILGFISTEPSVHIEILAEWSYHRGKVPNVREISYCIIKMCVIFYMGEILHNWLTVALIVY